MQHPAVTDRKMRDRSAPTHASPAIPKCAARNIPSTASNRKTREAADGGRLHDQTRTRPIYGVGVKLQLTLAVPAVASVMTPLIHMSLARKSLGA